MRGEPLLERRHLRLYHVGHEHPCTRLQEALHHRAAKRAGAAG